MPKHPGTRKRSRTKRILLIVAIVCAVLAGASIWYVNDYSHADAEALSIVADENGSADGVTVQQISGNALAFVPDHADAGLIFYPGGKVQPEAYAPLLERCAESGILCVLVKPLFNLAIIDMDCAEGIQEQFPDIDTWVLAGHSMGGVAACDFASRHEEGFAAIVLLAAYPAVDLTDYDGSVLSIFGSNDHVLNREKYAEAQIKLPASTKELEIAGGNHAYYGNYGEQQNDGTATISREDQQIQTAEVLNQLIHEAKR